MFRVFVVLFAMGFSSCAKLSDKEKKERSPQEQAEGQSGFVSEGIALTTSECTAIDGAKVEGSDACWILTARNTSCESAIEGLGSEYQYDSDTESFAGSGGNNTNCQLVLDALGANISGNVSQTNGALGCSVYVTFSRSGRRQTGLTDPGAQSWLYQRACAVELAEATTPSPTQPQSTPTPVPSTEPPINIRHTNTVPCAGGWIVSSSGNGYSCIGPGSSVPVPRVQDVKALAEEVAALKARIKELESK